jgi:aspartyl-tRNA(Asn)/glutamyl-tRNA(Gln) amidotransferase subunit A
LETASLQGRRIGVIRHFHERDARVSDELLLALQDAESMFATLGANVIDVQLPPLAQWQAVGMTLLLYEAYQLHEDWLRTRPEQYGASFRDSILLGALIDEHHYALARRQRAVLAAQVDEALRSVDLLMTAIQPASAPRLDGLSRWGFLERPSYGLPFNISDHPALSLRCGTGTRGLPLAMQLIGARGATQWLFAVGKAYETATGWPQCANS